LSGWITRFMVFNKESQWKGDYNVRLALSCNAQLPTVQYIFQSNLILSSTTYPCLDGTEIPARYAQVDVTLQREIRGPKYDVIDRRIKCHQS
ncbi:hypothetical protein J3A83DRAFT_4115706, partial [Scleroderma citrinum]